MSVTYKRIYELLTQGSLSLTHEIGVDKSGDAKASKATLQALSDLIVANTQDQFVGEGVIWWTETDPAVLGRRIILLTGQVLTISNYQDLCDIVYCGDVNNPTASAFYKTSDAGGTIRSTSGTYMVLPDLRGYALRGLDVAAAVDPDGASRDIGSIQLPAMWGHWHRILQDTTGNKINNVVGGNAGSAFNLGIIGATETVFAKTIITDGVNGTPLTSSESRMINIACKIGIRY